MIRQPKVPLQEQRLVTPPTFRLVKSVVAKRSTTEINAGYTLPI